MPGGSRRGRARRGTWSIVQRGELFRAQIDLGRRPDGSRDRRTKSFASRDEAEEWLADVRRRAEELTSGVADQTLAAHLRWWIEHEAAKGKPGRPPLADTTLQSYRSSIENHIIPALGNRKVGELTVAELDRFANAKLKEGLAPSTVNRFRETLRSALSTAVRQDRLPQRRPLRRRGRHRDATGRPVQRRRPGPHPRGRPRPTLLPRHPDPDPHGAACRRGMRAAVARRHADRSVAAAQRRLADRQVGGAGPPEVTPRPPHRPAAGRGGRGAGAVARPAGGVGRPARRGVGQPARPRVSTRTGGPVRTHNVSRC